MRRARLPRQDSKSSCSAEPPWVRGQALYIDAEEYQEMAHDSFAHQRVYGVLPGELEPGLRVSAISANAIAAQAAA